MAMHEILFYSGIYNFTVEAFLERLKEIPEGDEVVVRLNSPGGSVFAGWGLVAAIQERTGKTIVKIDGMASSMAFFWSLYFDEVQALDVSQLMIHRAEAWVENDDDQKMLDTVNADLRKAIEKRVNTEQFEKITGITIDELFTSKSRRDIWVTSKQAKKIGLVDSVTRLTPREVEGINMNLVAFSKHDSEEVVNLQGSKKSEKQIIINEKKEEMTIEKLKAEHPDIYAQIINQGVKQEKDRVEAILAFSDIDMKACKGLVESGENVTQKFMAEMTVKQMNASQLKDTKEDSDDEVEVDANEEKKTEEEETPVDAELEKFKQGVSAHSGRKVKED